MTAPAGRVLRLVLASFLLSAAQGALAGAQSVTPPAPSPDAVEITVYAAASLRDVLLSLGPICGKQARVRIVHNFGASNDLAQQIVAAHKADIFFSADEAWMDHVAAAGLVDAASRRSLLSNRLVVIVPEDSTLALRNIADLAQDAIKRVALGNPSSVPAGRYARAWLESAGLWEKVSPRVVPTPDVRAALTAVEAGAVEAGIVYRTDAATARKARLAFVASADEGPRISYPVAALSGQPHHDAARRVLACYAGRDARDLFERAGFIVLDAPAQTAR